MDTNEPQNSVQNAFAALVEFAQSNGFDMKQNRHEVEIYTNDNFLNIENLPQIDGFKRYIFMNLQTQKLEIHYHKI